MIFFGAKYVVVVNDRDGARTYVGRSVDLAGDAMMVEVGSLREASTFTRRGAMAIATRITGAIARTFEQEVAR